MSESDSTLPATDDFGSRFLEVDEYSCDPSEDNVNTEGNPTSTLLPRFRPYSNNAHSSVTLARSFTNRKEKSNNYCVSKHRTSSHGTDNDNCSVSITGDQSELDSQDISSEEDDELSTFRNPKLLTARQLSLKSQKAANSNHNNFIQSKNDQFIHKVGSDQKLLSLESLSVPKSNIPLTAEQLAARQKRIARRRESAKHKAELEKKQTVERLLKINADAIGRRGRGRGRVSMIADRNLIHSSSTSSLNDPISKSQSDNPNIDQAKFDIEKNDSSNEIKVATPTKSSESNSSDRKIIGEIKCMGQSENNSFNNLCLAIPKPGYLRFISSSKLKPTSLVCLPIINPVGESQVKFISKLIEKQNQIVKIPSIKFCDMGCGRPRRYACSRTGRSLCSLKCYQINVDNFNESVHISR